MKDEKIYIIDTYSYSSFHEMFNAAFVCIIAGIYQNVIYKASLSSYQNVMKLLSENDLKNEVIHITFKKIKVFTPGKNNQLKGLFRYFFSVIQNLRCLILSEKNSQIIFLNNNPFSTWLLSILNKFLKRDIIIFCHGELEALIQNPPKTNANYYYKYLLTRQLKNGKIHSQIKMCVFGEHILKNLKPFLNKRNAKQFYFIEHPYLFKKRENIDKKNNHELTIGTTGILNPDKGLSSFMHIAKNIDGVSLTVNGRVIGPIDKKQYPNVKFVADDYSYFIHRERYEEEISLMDYILFLYGNDSYKLIASGAVFDALDFEKPIIALRNDCFARYQNLEVGFFFDTVEEIIDFINTKLYNINKTQYNKFIENLRKSKKDYSIENVRNQLKNIIECTSI